VLDFFGSPQALAAAKATKEEREKGTAKGGDFQIRIYETLDRIAGDFEDTVEFVGDNSGPLGKVGDVLIRINPRYTNNVARVIVVETKNTSITLSGKNSFLFELDEAMKNRNADYAIGAVHEAKIPVTVGPFRRYDDSKIICSVPEDEYPSNLDIAYKVARAELVLAVARENEVKLDIPRLEGKVVEIRAQLDAMRSFKTALTGAKDKIDTACNDAKKIEQAIRDALDEITNLIKTGTMS
jgi:hypothetical protein